MSQSQSGGSCVWNASFIGVKKDVRDSDGEIEETPAALSRFIKYVVKFDCALMLSSQHVFDLMASLKIVKRWQHNWTHFLPKSAESGAKRLFFKTKYKYNYCKVMAAGVCCPPTP